MVLFVEKLSFRGEYEVPVRGEAGREKPVTTVLFVEKLSFLTTVLHFNAEIVLIAMATAVEHAEVEEGFVSGEDCQ